MRALKARDFVKYLLDNGCVFLRQKGSHQRWKRGTLYATVAGGRDISPGLVREICHELDIPQPL